MGNKNTTLPKCPGAGTTQKEEGACMDSASGSASGDGPPGPSPELLASLQSLRENSDYTLLPTSLHQMAEAYSLKEEYQWAIQFLQLEKMYHERLLSNLDTLQETWESQLRDQMNSGGSFPDETDFISWKHIETLSQICRTHHRPSVSVEQDTLNTTQETPQSCCDGVNKLETTLGDEDTDPNPTSSESGSHQEGREEERGDGEDEEETYEETPEEEEVKVEWPTGVPQASDKDLAKLSHTEGSSAPDGLVSILKRRRASLDGLPPPSNIVTKQNSKRKVRFSEPEDGIEQDEVGGDSCLILLLLCLVTVVISIGGTALYCTLVDTYSNICTDFTQNVDFYVMNIRRFFEGLRHWLPLQT